MQMGDTMRGSFYDSVAWAHKRAAILRRDRYLCRECARYGRRTPATVVHHIQHYEDHPELGLRDDNLISLCAGCHNKLHPERPAGGWRPPRRYE